MQSFPEHLKSIATGIVGSPVLDDDRKIAALQNLAAGLYTDGEALMLSKFHITSTPLKIFFLGKSHKLELSDSLCTKNHAAFVCSAGSPENLTEEQRVQRALHFQLAENSTIIRAVFYFKDGDDYLKVMWIDPMLMKIALEQNAREINRMLYQTDELESRTWIRQTRASKIRLVNPS